MAIQKFPRPTLPKVKTQTDDQIAKVGQINQLITDINRLSVTGPSPAGIPFEWYPLAGLTTGGVRYKYTDGTEILSYHIQGVASISTSGTGFEQYLCTVNFPDGSPFLFPGSITGMALSGYGETFVTTPLANGALVEVDNVHTPISNLQFILYPYGGLEPDGSLNYALVMSATVDGEGDISGLINYDYELLLPNFVKAPTIFQD